MKNISYDEFLNKTSLDFEIIGNFLFLCNRLEIFDNSGCKFGELRCSKSWKSEITKYGKCKSFNPAEFILGDDVRHRKYLDGI